MAAKQETTLEVEQEVLADRPDAFEAQAVKPLGEAQGGRPRMRCLDRDDVTFENPQPCRGAMEGIPLWHGF